MRGLCKILTVLTCLVLLPTAVFAQASLAGVVKDTSGAVLPGVTVEAASPALIEKTRSVVTDGTGQYRIVDLRPGTYSVTFTLPGFNTVKKDGVELGGTATVVINSDLKVGAVEETITVSGEAPVVDIQSTTKERVMNKETIDTIPTGRLYANLGVLVPGVSSNQADVGGSTGDNMPALTAHGSKAVDMRVTQNGVTTATLQAGGGIGMATPNVGAMQEVAIDSGSVSAELATGGPRINFIPKDGGNTFKGSLFATYANNSMQANNLSQDLINRGLKVADSLKTNYDINPGLGGPIKKDKIWFYYTGRWNKADNNIGGMFYNLNANNINSFAYAPDTSRQGYTDIKQTDNQMHLTFQATPRNKFTATYDQQTRCNCPFYVTATRSPEAGNDRRSPTQQLIHSDWSSPVTSRLLFEAVGLHRTERWGNMPPALEGFLSGSAPGLPGVVEQGGAIPGLQFRSGGTGNGTYNNNWVPNYFYRAAVSYITGSHAIKLGVNDAWGNLNTTNYNYSPLMFRMNNGVINQLTEFATPYLALNNENHDFGIFIQDKYTLKRATISYGARYDWFKTEFPVQTLGPAQFAPTRNATFPLTSNLNWKDWEPRFGIVYDLQGNGKTALKASVNKYLQGQGLNALGGSPNPVSAAGTSGSRTWTDRNGNFIPDCDLSSVAANGECAAISGGAGANFGKTVPISTFDPDLLTGWNHRNYNWEFSAGIQQQIMPRVSVDFGYFRRIFGNFTVTDNTLVSPADYTTYSYTTPVDANLPGGGAQAISGFYDLNVNKVGQVANYVSLSDKYGTQYDHWNGFDFSMNARMANGLLLQGGVSTGREYTNNCAVLAALPEMLNGNTTSGTQDSINYCNQTEPWLTQVKLVSSYRIPRVEVQVSGTYQDIPGPVVTANRVTLPGETTLGRAFSGGANATVVMVQNNTLYGDRRHQLDVRFGKILKFGSTRTVANLDLYNVLNSNAVLTQSNTYSNWRTPQSILTARYVKLGLTFDF